MVVNTGLVIKEHSKPEPWSQSTALAGGECQAEPNQEAHTPACSFCRELNS